MVKTRKIVLAKKVAGTPERSNFKLVEEELRQLKDDEILIKAEFLSVDPYIRMFVENLSEGDTITGEQVGRVVESKHKDFPVGTLVTTHKGWTTYSISDGIDAGFVPALGGGPLRKIDFPKGVSPSFAVGVLGMPGTTAYFALLDACKAKEGDTVFVNAASGAVGSVVGQIAKIKGCKTIGCAGTDQKVELLKTYGYDKVFNYKTEKLDDALTRTAPHGIDCYFDNVGGPFSRTVYDHLAQNARVAAVGALSQYNKKEKDKVSSAEQVICMKAINIKGFLFFQYQDQFAKAYDEMLTWIQEGKLKFKEDVTEGFENTPDAFIGLFSGANVGKAIVKV